MPQSLSCVLLHIIFSVKDRRPLLKRDIRPELFAYLATAIRNAGCECIRVGGTDDHVHLAIALSRTITTAKVIEVIKSSSSRWLKTKGLANFAWQRGYGVFSISASDRQALVRYIDSQEKHHAKYSFQDELRLLLDKYGISFDETYLWD